MITGSWTFWRPLIVLSLAVPLAVLSGSKSMSETSTISFPPPEFVIALPATSELALVDPATNFVKDVQPIPHFQHQLVQPTLVKASPISPVVWIGTRNPAGVEPYDTMRRGFPRGPTLLPAPPSSLAISPEGKRIYAVAGTAVVVTNPSGSFSATITLPAVGGGSTVAHNGADLYVAMPKVDRIAVINRESNQIVNVIYLGACNQLKVSCDIDGLTTSPDGRYVLGLSEEMPVVVVVDSTTHKVINRVALSDNCNGSFPCGNAPGSLHVILGIDPSTNLLWLGWGEHGGMAVSNMESEPPFTPAATGTRNLDTTFDRIAFSTFGQGVAVGHSGLAPHPGVFVQPELLSFPSLSTTVRLWTEPSDIVYEP